MDAIASQDLIPINNVFEGGPYKGASRHVGLVIRDQNDELRRLLKEAVLAGKPVVFVRRKEVDGVS